MLFTKHFTCVFLLATLTTTCGRPNSKERIVNDYSSITFGAPVDISYNETASHANQIVSSSGCPKSIEGYPWVKYQRTKNSPVKCYLVGTAGDCKLPWKDGPGVDEFYPIMYNPGSEFGICQCNFQGCLEHESQKYPKTPGNLQYEFCQDERTNYEYVFDKTEKRCWILYTQGPCKEEEWLEKTNQGGTKCSKRLCFGHKHLLSRESEHDFLLYGNVTETNAVCNNDRSVLAGGSDIQRNSCEENYVYSNALKKCMKRFQSTNLTVG